jgi:hypothetical protein
MSADQRAEAVGLARAVRQTLAEQSAGWAERPLFERQWVTRDFKRFAGQTADDWLRVLTQLEQDLAADNGHGQRRGAPVRQLALYYKHMQEVLAGWEKDAAKREAHMQVLKGWEAEAARLAALVD